MRIRKIFAACLLVLALGVQVLPIYAATSPAESEIFTTDANPDEITRVAFFVLDDSGAGEYLEYYREVEGYLLPTESTVTLNRDIFEAGLYDCMYHFITHFGFIDVGEWGDGVLNQANNRDSVTLDGTIFAYEIIATNSDKVEWLYFAPNTIDSSCYRVLAEGEVVDSGLRYVASRELVEKKEFYPLTESFSTTATEDEISKVLFKLATGDDENPYWEVEGYLIPKDEYVALENELFRTGSYGDGFHRIGEDGIAGRSWYIGFLFYNDGTFRTNDTVYDIRVTLPSGETEIFYCAADTINPACYTIIEEIEESTEVEEVVTEVYEIIESTEEKVEDVVNEDTANAEEIPAETAWLQIHPEAVPLAVASAVVLAGSVSAVGAAFTPTVEVASGIKAKRGTLVVNGDVEIPEVHYEHLDDIAIPVQVTEADDINWVFMAKTFTPGYKKLVKTIVVPTGGTSAEVKMKLAEDYATRITEDLEIYLEVAALGIDIHGEKNLLEKMAEITVSRKVVEEQGSDEKKEEAVEEVKEETSDTVENVEEKKIEE